MKKLIFLVSFFCLIICGCTETKVSNEKNSDETESFVKEGNAAKKTPAPLQISLEGYLGEEINKVQNECQMQLTELSGIEKDNAEIYDMDDDEKVDLIVIDNHSDGGFTLFNMKGNAIFNEKNIPPKYYFYDSIDTFANEKEASYTKSYYISQDGHECIECEYMADKSIKRIRLVYSKDKIVSEEAGESFNEAGDYTGAYQDDSLYDTDYDEYEENDYNNENDYDEYNENYYDGWSNYTENYILQYSSIKELKKSDLEDLSKSELRLARNEIYARHGRRFQDQELQDYFDSQEWYMGYIEPEDFIDSEELSDLERKNINFIKKFE